MTQTEMEVSLHDSIRSYIVNSGVPQQLMASTPQLLGYDPSGGPYDWAKGGWVMGSDPAGNPYRDVESTGLCAIVFYIADEWAAPATFRSAQYPRLHLQVWADPDRDADGSPTQHNAEDKARHIWRLLHPLFHDPANVIHAFDTLRVHSTVQGGTWSIMEVPNGDGSVRGDCTYNLHLD